MFNTSDSLELQHLMKKGYSRIDALKILQKRRADEQRRQDDFNSYRSDDGFGAYMMGIGGIMAASSSDDSHSSSSSFSSSSDSSSSYDSGGSFDSSF